jgi:hypothetical protein
MRKVLLIAAAAAVLATGLGLMVAKDGNLFPGRIANPTK